MKVLVIDGNQDMAVLHSFVSAIEDAVDKFYKNECVLNVSFTDEKSDKDILDNISYSYKEDDFDIFIYASYKELGSEQLTDRIKMLCNVKSDDLFYVNSEERYVGICKVKEFLGIM